MKKISSGRIGILVFLSFFVASGSTCESIAQPCETPVAKIVSVQGSVEAKSAGETGWQPVTLNETFCQGDTIRVLEKSRADVTLMNRSFLRINENTTIILEGVLEERTSLIDLLKGAAHFFSREPRSLKVKTQYAIFGVRGTEFYIRAEETRSLLSVFEGSVLAENAAGSLVLTSGQSALAEANMAPVLRVVARPRDAVQWALYYPPVMYDIPLEVIEMAPQEISDPRILAQRAALLLDVGRLEEALADLDRTLRLKADYSDALSLQAIIAIVQNDRDKALDLAQKAVDADPNSATALISLSYAQQARFDLKGALSALEEAVTVAPSNALAWARLADIQASFGNIGKALDAAQKAESLAPDLALTQTVLGFAYLTQVKINESKVAFEKAIALDQASPMPRLGLGLAKIRQGDLDAGGLEIEIAASLDPNNSIIRSYLGKTYYEKKRMPLDEREYQIAKELDPNDPTPWFYDAIAKQTTNRPVEALHNFQKAIELNDNRFVYRSKLLLDSDLAARSASLARIYDNLGFQQLAIVEGYKAVNTDPGNFSAHRFLADSYAGLPRHEIARVSELLQSQLLQPINITPIQPTLAESNLFLISSLGPSVAGFSTFNPLFNRNQAVLQADGLVGNDSTWGAEGVVSGIYDKLSLSAGYTRFKTDGWRENADQDDGIVDVFAQYQLTYRTSIQAEYRHRKVENGDLQLRFFEDDFRQSQREETDTDSVRLGFRHSFSPNSAFIGNFSYKEEEFTQTDRPGAVFGPFAPIIDLSQLNFKDKAYGSELQYQFRSKYADIVSGGGYFDIDTQKEEVTEIFFPIPPFPPPPFGPGGTSETTPNLSDLGANHANLYLYSYIHFPKDVTVTLGASVDFFDSDSKEGPEKDQFNPKLGITWKPFANTTLRGAVFRVLKRTLLTDQTLEPTQVAGFNQFYDDTDGTESWRYGVAIDQILSRILYGGAEFSKRELTVPVLRSGAKPGELDWDEDLFRVYLYWTPHKWLAIGAEYLYEKFDRDERFSDGAFTVATHYIPLGINFFHPSGLGISLKGTRVDQDGEFERLQNVGSFLPGEDTFWVFDTAFSYRFPKRYGFLTIGATNLFDEDFEYFDTDRNNPRIRPGRAVFAKLTLAIP